MIPPPTKGLRLRTLAMAALAAASVAKAAGSSPPRVAIEPLQLRVMTFNVWYGGEQVNFANVAAAIRAADPDVIGIQEPDGNLQRIAAAAGYAHVDPRRNLISRYPLFDAGPDGAAMHAWVMPRAGEVVAVANTHLSSDLYGPESIRDGATLEQVLADEERTRLREVRPLLALGDLPAATPILLTGDFNTPSHRDWTGPMQKLRPEAIRYSVEWPVTRLLEDAGFRDSYRDVHVDPVQRPGYTWTAGMPHPYVRPRETIDRIDFIWSKGPIRTLRSEIVGEPGGREVDVPVHPYPSDHRAVVSTFSLVPAPAPALVSIEPRTVSRGEDALVRGHDPRSEGWRIAIVRRGAGIDQVLLRLEESITAWRPAGRFSSRAFDVGDYDAVLLGEEGEELARTGFIVRDAASAVQLQLVNATVRSGDRLRVRWSNGLGNKHDWIGIFRAGAALGDALVRHYIAARYRGELELPTRTDAGPMTAGDYELRLMRDDSPTVEASLPFTLR